MEICKFMLFGGVGISTCIKWYNYVTYEEVDVYRFIKTDERIFNLKKLYKCKRVISLNNAVFTIIF